MKKSEQLVAIIASAYHFRMNEELERIGKILGNLVGALGGSPGDQGFCGDLHRSEAASIPKIVIIILSNIIFRHFLYSAYNSLLTRLQSSYIQLMVKRHVAENALRSMDKHLPTSSMPPYQMLQDGQL